ncbi:MAG TPA: site-2 protease family protein [Candidatus Limnocylindrales bacterium]
MNIPLGRVFGTEIRAHWTWVPILAFIAVVFSLDLTAGGGSDWPPALAWAASIGTAALVFVSVTAHELAHVAVARRNGMEGPVVVIQLLGGTFVTGVSPKTPGQEFRIAAAGPALTLAVTAVLGVVAAILTVGPVDINRAAQGLQALQFVAAMLCVFNGFLAFVNLIPGYPLDGARIVHALAWRRTGQEAAATAAAVRVGRYVGLVLMAAGALVMFLWDLFGGLGLVVAGWLIVGSSRLLDRRTVLQSLVAGLVAGDATDSEQARVPPQLTLDVFAAEYLGERLGTAALVERGAELIGLVGTAQVRRIPRRSWPNTRTEQAMVPIANVPRISGDTGLWTALEMLERSGLDALLLAPAGVDQALVTRRSAARLIHVRAEEHQREMLVTGRGKRGRFGGL